jgi:general L-amino acid transport system permease protein
MPPAKFGRRPLINSLALRSTFYQTAALLAATGILSFFIFNAADNLERLGVAFGFDFLTKEAGYTVGESFIPHSARDTYRRTFVVGALNTLYVAVVSLALATVLGTIMGVARVSSNWLVAKLSAMYVEVCRNVPELLHIMFWYAVTRSLPPPRQALHPLQGVFLSNRGLSIPAPTDDPVFKWMVLALATGAIATLLLARIRRAPRALLAGRSCSLFMPSLILVFGLPLAVWILAGRPASMDFPELRGFNFHGGWTLTPEFVGLVTGLVVYHSGFIAEIVRAGILSVGRGQREAARALGLKPRSILARIVLPQALRVAVPPITNQYLSLVKSSSLGVVIGYPELVNIGNTAINQTGQAIEVLIIIMSVYLVISVSISAAMNIYNRFIMLKGMA